MAKKKIEISKYFSKKEAVSILNRLGNKMLTKSGQGYNERKKLSIREAAEKNPALVKKKWKQKPALGLISVVLAANRNYNQAVEPNIKNIDNNEPDLCSFKQLGKLIKEKTFEQFATLWGHHDRHKYSTLKQILKKIEVLKTNYPDCNDDYLLMH